MNKKYKKIGLALGGGGARGLAHIGVLKVFEKEGIKPDFIAGTSIGSIVGAIYALDPENGLKVLEEEAKKLENKIYLSKLVDVNSFKKSVLKGEKLHKYLYSLVGDAKFGNTKIPLWVVATDLEDGTEKVLKRGSIMNAIKASICVPGVLPPVEIGGKLFIDGSIVNPTPTDLVKEMGADVIIGVDLLLPEKMQIEKPTMTTILMQSYEIIRKQAIKVKMKKSEKCSIILQPKMRSTIDSFKFHNTEVFIKAGEKVAQENLPKILKALEK